MIFVAVVLNYSMDFGALKHHLMGSNEPQGPEILYRHQNLNEDVELENYSSIIDEKHSDWEDQFNQKRNGVLEQVTPLIPEPMLAMLCLQSWWPANTCQSEDPVDDSVLDEHVKIWADN